MVNIVSHLPMAVRLHEPHPDPDKPGNSPVLRSVVIPGKTHPDARPMVTRGVDDEIWNAWLGANPHHFWHKDKMIHVASDKEADDMDNFQRSYGFEPGLESIDTAGHAEGSLEGDNDHRMVDMNAYSNAPNDDSPRSQTEGIVSGGVVATPPPMDPEGPAFDSRNAKRGAEPEPTDVHDETFRESFKDHAGQEEPKVRGKTKGEMDEKPPQG